MRAVNMFLISLLLLTGAVGNNVHKIKPRMFGRRYTKTVTKPHVITSFIPSSCVLVDATLPPCRTLRSFETFPRIEPPSTLNDSFVNTTINDLDIPQEPAVQTTPLSWGEYLGIYAPTVTVTSTHIVTTTIVDPEVQVTYAIRGCRPKLLPANMERCDTSEAEADGFNILPTSTNSVIQPTTTLYPLIVSESVGNITTTAAPTLIQLEGSGSTTEQEVPTSVNTPTEGLDEVSTVNI